MTFAATPIEVDEDGVSWRSCTKCEERKRLDVDFYRHASSPSGRHSECKDCYKGRSRRQHHERGGRERLKARYYANGGRDGWARNLRRFELTPDDYERMLDEQGHVCALCSKPETATFRGKPRRLAVDHDHETGLVRGLLCAACNTELGVIEKHRHELDRLLAYADKVR